MQKGRRKREKERTRTSQAPIGAEWIKRRWEKNNEMDRAPGVCWAYSHGACHGSMVVLYSRDGMMCLTLLILFFPFSFLVVFLLLRPWNWRIHNQGRHVEKVNIQITRITNNKNKWERKSRIYENQNSYRLLYNIAKKKSKVRKTPKIKVDQDTYA